MKIIADENISEVKAIFAELGEVQTLPGRAMTQAKVAHADVLLVRSVTPVNQALLEGSAVKFVGTCTIGTDHIDQDYLRNQGIGFASAPGCNANAVVDYVLSSLAALALEQGFSLQQKTLGIVGLGNVGSRLKERAEAFGLKCLCSDPPLQRQGVRGLISLPDLIANADIISLHTPLTRAGEDVTLHLLNAENLALLKTGAVLLNSSRGGVIDNLALQQFLCGRPDISVVLDVWESEPAVGRDLLALVRLATPHIAGYSLEGKLRGTAMVYDAVCKFFGLLRQRELRSLFPTAREVILTGPFVGDWEEVAFRAILQCYDVREDSWALKALAAEGNESIGVGFDGLRKRYRMRRELNTTKLVAQLAPQPILERLAALGLFQSCSSEPSSSSQAF